MSSSLFVAHYPSSAWNPGRRRPQQGGVKTRAQVKRELEEVDDEIHQPKKAKVALDRDFVESYLQAQKKRKAAAGAASASRASEPTCTIASAPVRKRKAEDDEIPPSSLKKKKKTTVLPPYSPKVSLNKDTVEKYLEQQRKRVDKEQDGVFDFRDFLEKESFEVQAAQILKNIYYNERHPASFSSPRKLYLAAKKQAPIDISFVKRWLSRQRAYTQTRYVRKTFDRRKILVRGLAYQYQADLMDITERANVGEGGTDFLLCVIDCFSRFAQVAHIGRKKASNVVRGFKRVFGMMMVPKKIQTDGGSEFFARETQDFFDSLGIIHFTTDQEMKAQIVERFNRTLRERISRYRIANNTMDFLPALDDIVYGYNSSAHSSLGNYAPMDVTFENEARIREIQYGPYFRDRAKAAKFKIGDVVRVVNIRQRQKRNMKKWKDELYVITDVIYSKPVTYHVKTRRDNVAVEGAYYEPQLQPVDVPAHPKWG